MPQTVKASVADMRGHEVKNLVVTDDGCLALSEELKPSLMPPLKPLKVALPSNFGEYQMAAISLVSVICNRRISFVFVDREDDPAYCDADFVFAEFSPIWGGDNDTWENMLGVIRNTRWFMSSFKELTAAEAFLRIVYDEHYDGLEDRMALDRLEGRSPYKIAVHQLMYCQQRMSTLLKLQRIRDKMLDALRWEVLKERPGILVVPEESCKMSMLEILNWIALVQKETDSWQKNPVHAVVLHKNDSWYVFPALKLEDDGSFQEIRGVTKVLKHDWVLKKYNSRAEALPLCKHAVCPDSKTAVGVAVWMVDYYAGKGTKLESILK